MRLDRESGSHACTISGDTRRRETRALLDRFFKLHELVSEPEPKVSSQESLFSKSDVADNRAQMTAGLRENLDKVKIDKNMLSFNERMRREPRQILRYIRVSQDPSDSVSLLLWASDSNIPPSDFPPDCPICSSPRLPEFQILPQALSHAGKTYSEKMDVGILVIYTCSRSCSTAGSSNWVSEVAWHQLV